MTICHDCINTVCVRAYQQAKTCVFHISKKLKRFVYIVHYIISNNLCPDSASGQAIICQIRAPAILCFISSVKNSLLSIISSSNCHCNLLIKFVELLTFNSQTLSTTMATEWDYLLYIYNSLLIRNHGECLVFRIRS